MFPSRAPPCKDVADDWTSEIVNERVYPARGDLVTIRLLKRAYRFGFALAKRSVVVLTARKRVHDVHPFWRDMPLSILRAWFQSQSVIVSHTTVMLVRYSTSKTNLFPLLKTVSTFFRNCFLISSTRGPVSYVTWFRSSYYVNEYLPPSVPSILLQTSRYMLYYVEMNFSQHKEITTIKRTTHDFEFFFF